MIETDFGLGRLGHTDGKDMPYPLQAALTAREFSDVIVFRSPPLAVQQPLFGALALEARWRGYRRPTRSSRASCRRGAYSSAGFSSPYFCSRR
jgi:hypothetical protein